MNQITMPEKSKRLFFIGIGGVSMRALASLSKRRGYEVGGSDRVDSPALDKLRAEGITVSVGHREENIRGYDVVIYNAAIHEDNPEYAYALSHGLVRLYRTDYLAALMGSYPHAVGVAGMHGKSTTSAMLSHLYLYAKKDPSVLIGAETAELGGTFREGRGEDFIFEACEYKDSFLSLNPTVAVVLNVEMDHPDYFHSMEQVRHSFHEYLSIPGRDGFGVVNADSPDAMRSAENTDTPIVTYGIRGQGDYQGQNIHLENGFYAFDITRHGTPLCHVHLKVPGLHNVQNALACAAVADLGGMDGETVGGGLSSFTGARRRMEYKGTFPGTSVPVFDDFGHHPTEIRSTLSGARAMGYERIFCVYQPHTYSRTAELFDEFTAAFTDADCTLFADIYAARETDTLGVSSEKLAQATPRSLYFSAWEDITDCLRRNLRQGDALIIMGAGDIAAYADALTKETDV